MHENKRQLVDQDDLGKSSAHGYNSTQLENLLADITSTAAAYIEERESQKEVNKIMLVNKNNMEPHHGTIMANYHRKRTKPRLQSGSCMANMTEKTFKSTRPLLSRDDSIFLLKQNTINAIPRVVPLVPAGQEGTSSPRIKLQGAPLSRIRRRKPRRMSGEAGQGRPVLLRDDSILLTKKKMGGSVPMSQDTTAAAQEESRGATPAGVGDKTVHALKIATIVMDTTVTKKVIVIKKSPVRSKSFHGIPRLTLSQKQQGFVRQHSFSPACA